MCVWEWVYTCVCVCMWCALLIKINGVSPSKCQCYLSLSCPLLRHSAKQFPIAKPNECICNFFRVCVCVMYVYETLQIFSQDRSPWSWCPTQLGAGRVIQLVHSRSTGCLSFSRNSTGVLHSIYVCMLYIRMCVCMYICVCTSHIKTAELNRVTQGVVLRNPGWLAP